jgi:hypothetical protein
VISGALTSHSVEAEEVVAVASKKFFVDPYPELTLKMVRMMF